MSETDLAEVWARSLEDLNGMQIEAHQRAWLKLTRPLGLVENTALIATPNEFVKEQLETRLRTLITHALSRELGRRLVPPFLNRRAHRRLSARLQRAPSRDAYATSRRTSARHSFLQCSRFSHAAGVCADTLRQLSR